VSDCLDISWTAAWDRWWADQVVADCRLYGEWTIRAWGRMGKVLLFVSAGMIVFDLVGMERIRRIGGIAAWIGDPYRKHGWKMLALAFGVLFFAVVLAPFVDEKPALSGALATFYFTVNALVAISFFGSIWGWLLLHPRLHRGAQIITTACLLIGFTLDLLAS
jgi:hypothetical protein